MLENVWKFLIKVNMHSNFDSVIAVLCFYIKIKNQPNKRRKHRPKNLPLMFITPLFTLGSEKLEQLQRPPAGESTRKPWHVRTLISMVSVPWLVTLMLYLTDIRCATHSADRKTVCFTSLFCPWSYSSRRAIRVAEAGCPLHRFRLPSSQRDSMPVTPDECQLVGATYREAGQCCVTEGVFS